jgi:hypothetical protein
MGLKINTERVKSLAQDLENGFSIFVNKDTGETKILMDNKMGGSNDPLWKEESQEIKKWNNYATIEPPRSYEAFEFMESFIAQVGEPAFRTELEQALHRRGPLNDFISLIESSNYREDWFAHYKQCYVGYLTKHLKWSGVESEG